MSYTPKTWENKPSTASPINATNLNHMEGGIKTNDDNIIGAQNAILILQGEMLQAQGDISALETLVDSIFPIDTESGNPAVITDAFGGSCKSLKLTLEPIQSGSGTPSPQNVRPISGRTQSVLRRYNVYNIFSPLSFTSESISGVTVTYEGNGTYRVKGTSTSSTDFSFTTIPIDPFIIYGGDNREIKFNNTADMPNVRLFFYEEDGTSIDSWNLAPADRYYEAYVGMRNKRIGRFLISIGGALYNTPLDFTFKVEIMDNTDKSSITRTYGTTIYGGSDDVTGEGATSEVALVDMASLEWTYRSDIQVFQCANVGVVFSTDASKQNLCSCYDYNGVVASGALAFANGKFSIYSGGTYLWVCDTNYNDADVFKASLTGQKIALYLATPTSIPLTAQNITLLHGDNVLTTDADSIEASYSADIALYIAKKIAEGISQGNRSLSKGGVSEEEPKEEEKKEEVEIKEEEPLTKEVR